MAAGFYTSRICGEHCDHRHHTEEQAARCAAKRISGGELRARMGAQEPLRVPQHELLATYIGRSYDGAHRH